MLPSALCSLRAVVLALLHLSADLASAQTDRPLSCRDQRGRAVDWWLALKFPRGGQYAYLDNTAPQATAQAVPMQLKGQATAKSVVSINDKPPSAAADPTRRRGKALLKSQRSMLSAKELSRQALDRASPSQNSQGWSYREGLQDTAGNPLAETLQQLYRPPPFSESADNAFGYVIYNDAFPNGTVTFELAHAKGVLGFDVHQGFWLVHSLPHFPEGPREGPYKGIGFPQQLFAQSLLCISLAPADLDSVALMLRTTNLHLYEVVVPQAVAGTYPGLLRLVNGTDTGVPLTATLELSTLEGQAFTALTKGSTPVATGPRVYLYEQLVEPYFHSSMFVETWQRQGAMPSYCVGPLAQYDSLNVRSMHFKEADQAWSYTMDHSKWAVSAGALVMSGNPSELGQGTLNSTGNVMNVTGVMQQSLESGHVSEQSRDWQRPTGPELAMQNVQTDQFLIGAVSCIGDINREEGQLYRGGGTLCFVGHVNVWSSLRGVIGSVEGC